MWSSRREIGLRQGFKVGTIMCEKRLLPTDRVVQLADIIFPQLASLAGGDDREAASTQYVCQQYIDIFVKIEFD